MSETVQPVVPPASEPVANEAATPAPTAAPATPAERPNPFLRLASAQPQGGRGPQGGGRGGNNARGGQGGRGGAGGRGGDRRGPRRDGDVPAEADYAEKNLEVARVTRVTKGGKRMRFRVLSVIGNQKGRVGFGLAKGVDVAGASTKSTAQARKSLITVPLVDGTIPHMVVAKFRAAEVLLKPAPKGTGVKAGGAIRPVLEFAGVQNVVSKMLGSSNKANNVKATMMALKQLRAHTSPKTETGSDAHAA
ncbi:30S ribosomal protein S5 [Patescibacteria group bacterium]|jgi:small subunit ribosomal protein S5|nr:30S ribosomal protein S5 [Patescibacteria group bacterium]MDQ5919652.1 small subunit ribosomal protein [Patescibacteria group bacterium]